MTATVFLTCGVAVFLLLFLLWIVSVRIRDASIIDPFWGFGFVVVAWVCWLRFGGSNPESGLVTFLVSIWGLRLSAYLLWRNLGHEEDRRYAAMREKRGDSFWWKSLYIVFWLQALLLVVISVPIQFSVTSTNGSIGWLVLMGCSVFAVGLFFETIGDWQLARFKANPANHGSILDTGLWGLTRHPNYFGDFCVWWGLYLVAAAAGGWWTVFSPVLMSFLLMRVSGVTLLESDIAERRPGYREYIQSTNAFFPGWKRTFTGNGTTGE